MPELAADGLEVEEGFEEVSDGDGEEEEEGDPPEHVVDYLRHVQELLGVCGC